MSAWNVQLSTTVLEVRPLSSTDADRVSSVVGNPPTQVNIATLAQDYDSTNVKLQRVLKR